MLSSQLISLASIVSLGMLPGILAVPAVDPVPLRNGCEEYFPYTGGPLAIQIVESGNKTVEGYHATKATEFADNGHIATGNITFSDDQRLAKVANRCSNGTFQGLLDSERNPTTGERISTWAPYLIGPSANEARLTWSPQGLFPAVTYLHYVDGAQQSGVFVGGPGNHTTWALRYNAPDVSSNVPYFSLRLLLVDSPRPAEDEFTAFLQIVNL